MDEQTLFTALDARQTETFVTDVYMSRQTSWRDWKKRQAAVEDIIDGKWSVTFPDGSVKVQTPLIENLVVSGIEDTARLAGSVFPTLRVEAPTEAGMSRAMQREQAIAYYWQLSRLRVKLTSWYRDLCKGLAAIHVWPDFSKDPEARFPMFNRIDPKTVVVPPGWDVGTEPDDVMTSRMVKARYLKNRFPLAASQMQVKVGREFADTDEVEVIEYWDTERILCIARSSDGRHCVPLYSAPNRINRIPVILIGRDSADGNLRGQFDNMIAPMLGKNRLMSYVADYVDQGVYAPITKKNIPGAVDIGPGAIIDLGSEGDIGRLPPAQMDTSVWRFLQEMGQEARNSGVVPESRSGHVRQAIISAAGIDALNGGQITVVGNLQTSFADGLERANEVALLIDRTYCDTRKSIVGYAQGGQFRMAYTPSDLIKKGETGNIVNYGAGAGLDEFNRTIRIIQLLGSGVVSKRWAMENIPGIDNPLKMEGQIFSESILAMLIQTSLQKAAQGDDSALRGLVELNEDNENLLEVAKKVLEGSEPSPPSNVVPINAAQQALSLQKGGIPGGQNLAPEGDAMPPLSELLGS